MSVRFVIGRAGAGKTEWCFQRIVAELRNQPMGPGIYWLLPRQATFQTERDLVCRGGLDGFFRVRVLSLDEMASEVLSDSPAAVVPRITDKGRRLIFAHLLRVHRDRLRFFKSVAEYPGMAGQLDAVLSELHRQGTDVQEAAAKLNSAPDAAPPALAAKFHDIALLHGEYLHFIGDQRLDPERRMAQAVSAVADSPLLRDAIVYVDAFDDFTFFERRFVTAIAQAAGDTSITFLLDPASRLLADPHHALDDDGVLCRTESAYRSLWVSLHQSGIAIDTPVRLDQPRRFVRPELDRLERSFLATEEPMAPAAPESSDVQTPSVEFHEAHDRRGEADLAARKIRDLVLAGMRYRDIAVLVRDLAAYGDLIHGALREHGVPCFIDRRRPAAHHPLPRLIRAALAIARSNWPHPAVMSALKSGLLDIDPQHADELENYALACGIVGGQWIDDPVWTDLTPEVQDARQRLVQVLLPFAVAVAGSSSRPVRQFAQAVLDLLDCASVRNRLARWIDSDHSHGRLEQAEEHRQTWAECSGLLQQLVDLMPDVSMPLDEFAAVLETSLDELDLALAPQTADQVLVGSIDRTHTPVITAAIVMGLSEGIFPRPNTSVRILTDPERRALADRGISVDPDSQHVALEEKFLGYRAFTRASQLLVLTRPRCDEGGRPLKPSSLWQHARDALGPSAQALPDREDQAQAIATPRQLIATLAQWSRDDKVASLPSDDPRPALYQWLAQRQPAAGRDDPIDTMRFVAWKSLSYTNTASLLPQTARSLLAPPREDEPGQLRLTLHDITSFRNCRFQHFCGSSLRLMDRTDPALDGRRIATINRKVLDDALGELTRARKDLTALDETQRHALVGRAMERVADTMFGGRARKSPETRYSLDRVRGTLNAVIRSQQQFAQAGQFRPNRTHVSFGDDGTLPPVRLRTECGTELLISGRIDRIDLGQSDAAGNRPALAVTYKLGVSGIDMAMVYEGRDIELLILLLALGGAEDRLGGQAIIPAAALAVPTARAIQFVSDPDKALPPDDPAFWLRPKPRGIIDSQVATQLDKNLAGASDVIAAYRKKDGEFGNPRQSDLVSSEQLGLLLSHVEQCLQGAAGQMLRGDIAIRPYMRAKQTPCPHCAFRDVCRLERGDEVYEHIEPKGRVEVLKILTEHRA